MVLKLRKLKKRGLAKTVTAREKARMPKSVAKFLEEKHNPYGIVGFSYKPVIKNSFIFKHYLYDRKFYTGASVCFEGREDSTPLKDRETLIQHFGQISYKFPFLKQVISFFYENNKYYMNIFLHDVSEFFIQRLLSELHFRLLEAGFYPDLTHEKERYCQPSVDAVILYKDTELQNTIEKWNIEGCGTVDRQYAVYTEKKEMIPKGDMFNTYYLYPVACRRFASVELLSGSTHSVNEAGFLSIIDHFLRVQDDKEFADKIVVRNGKRGILYKKQEIFKAIPDLSQISYSNYLRPASVCASMVKVSAETNKKGLKTHVSFYHIDKTHKTLFRRDFIAVQEGKDIKYYKRIEEYKNFLATRHSLATTIKVNKLKDQQLMDLLSKENLTKEDREKLGDLLENTSLKGLKRKIKSRKASLACLYGNSEKVEKIRARCKEDLKKLQNVEQMVSLKAFEGIFRDYGSIEKFTKQLYNSCIGQKNFSTLEKNYIEVSKAFKKRGLTQLEIAKKWKQAYPETINLPTSMKDVHRLERPFNPLPNIGLIKRSQPNVRMVNLNYCYVGGT
jgi:hypothetical protein